MKSVLAICISLLALAACQPQEAPANSSGAPQASAAQASPAEAGLKGCAAQAEAPWGPVGPGDQPSYRILAYANGGICEASVVTLAIVAPDGSPVFTWASAAETVFGLADQADAAAMTRALSDWIDPEGGMATTGRLPPWEETEGQARRAEFPFMPSEWFDKATYEALRAEAAPLYCFTQGLESETCLALRDGRIEEIGLQLFPG